MKFKDAAAGRWSLIVLRAAVVTTALVGCAAAASSERVADLNWAVQIAEAYPTISASNITYLTANNFEAKLDVYSPIGNDRPKPTLVFFHGGGWMGGFTKEMYPFSFLPFLQLGWNVVNVEYRPSTVSLAPAAVQDSLCALRWVSRNAQQYHIDPEQIVLMGQSAGGLLALTTGMIPPSTAGLNGPCVYADAYGPSPQSARIVTAPATPAAIISWSGVTDVVDVAEGPNRQGYATIWLGDQPDRLAIARMVSPLSYVRAGLPAIVMIHGDSDPLVPYAQAVRLHAALVKAGVPTKLITIPGGGHGLFGVQATRDAWTQVFDFLQQVGLTLRLEP